MTRQLGALVLSVFIVCLLFGGTVMAATGEEGQTQMQEAVPQKGEVRVLEESNIRIGPGTEFEVLMRAYEDEVFSAIALVGNWYVIETEQGQAYIHSTRVEELGAPPAGDIVPTQPEAELTASVEQTQAPTPTANPTVEPKEKPVKELKQEPFLASSEPTTPTLNEKEEVAAENETKIAASTIVVIILLAVIAIVVILLIRKSRVNVEIVLQTDRGQKIKRLIVRQEKTIFIDITKYVMFHAQIGVRIMRSLIEKASTSIYIQMGDQIIEANMFLDHGKDYSTTYVKFDWDRVEMRTAKK